MFRFMSPSHVWLAVWGGLVLLYQVIIPWRSEWRVVTSQVHHHKFSTSFVTAVKEMCKQHILMVPNVLAVILSVALLWISLLEEMVVFPCHGCFLGFVSHIINSCLICCNTALQKLLSLFSRHNVSDAWGWAPYDEVFNYLWDSLTPSICAHLCNTFGNGHFLCVLLSKISSCQAVGVT